MSTTLCPRCTGRTYVAAATGRSFTVCPDCRGRGRVELPPTVVHAYGWCDGGAAVRTVPVRPSREDFTDPDDRHELGRVVLTHILTTNQEALRLLEQLVTDDLVGWTILTDQWACFYCGVTHPVEEGRDDPPAHHPTCAVKRARALLARSVGPVANGRASRP